ncbi:protein NLRC5-like [Dysidea avara]|uniref:protein NLRC5-like n=1 Tax=Dysidea avara TaxID=196820 RepID=UPI0033221404
MLDEWLNIDACARWGTIIKALDSPKVVAVKKSFSNPNTILQYSEVDMLEAVLEVANRLQKNSKSSRYSKTEDEWPPYRPKHFTSIALIHYKKGHSTKKEITFVASIQHTGQLSQTEPPCSHIIQTSSEFSEVFSKIEGTSEFPNTVLIEGAPGIGKTTLCKEIIFQWSGQKLLENKKLVVLIFLRDPIAQSIISLKDFIRYYCIYTEIGNSILEEYIKSTAGKDIAIVLDGYDELPENIRKNPEHSELFFIKLIHQRKYTHMSQCTVVITSRLNVSGELHGIVDRRVEILGFTENNRKEYIQQALKDNKENVEKMLSYLDRNPSINAYCYIPLNMTILLCLFAEGEENSELPATQTEINRMFICITISRFIRKTQKVKMECGISNFKDMPKEFKHIFIGLCRLAYKTLRDDKIVFSKREIQNYCKHLARTENCHGLGLLKAVEFYSTRENVKSMSFNFLHLSLQETLAAYHIYLSSINKQARLLENKFMDSRYFNTWIMYVGFTKGQSFPFAFEHFLSGNSLKVITFVSSLFKQDAKISEKFITDKVICLHLFQCFSEAENDDMCQFVGQLLQDGEIDLSDQTLNTVNIHTIGLFLDRSSIKHWKLLKLSNCNLSTLEIERLFILCRKVCIDQLDLSYNNLTQMPTDILANVFLTWNVKKVIMYSNVFETSYRYNIINNCVRQFSKLKLVPLPFQTEIFALDQPILVVCKCSYQEIIATLSKNNYSSIHLFSCQLGSALYEITQLNLMSESSKNIYLYNCEISCSHVLEIVRKMEISSVHFMEESNISSKELGYVVEQLAELAITLGKEMLPLHIYNMAETSFLAAKELMQDGTPGTFVFRHCTDQDIHEIASYYNSQNNISRFILKHCTGYHGESISSNVVTNNLSNLFSNNILLRHLSLCNCKLQNDTVHELLDTTMKLTNLQHIILSGNSISNKTAELLATSIINAKFLEHLELEGCNLHQIGLELVSKAINSSNLLTLNLNYNCITDQVANNLADVIASKSCLENLCMSKCSLQYGAKAIVSALAKITSLKILDLSYNKITNSSFDLIAVTKTNIHLEHLNMSYCELKQDSMIEVLKAHCTDLKLIDFSGNDINDSAAVCLPNFVNSAPLLQTLALAKCHLEETDLIDTLRAVKHSLNYLDISFNTITVKAAKSVADLIHNNVDLEYFDLSNCNIQEEGLILILKEVRTACYLKYIDVQSNSLNNALASELAVFISSSHTLSHLSLSNCALQEDGFLRIADSLVKTKTLTHLDISSNFISNNVGAKLALTVVFSKKSQLKHLDVSECQWQENGLTKFLTSAMIVCSLRHINYSSCKLDDEQAKYLANSIISNGTLEHLILANCALTPVGLISIFDALTKLHKLKHIDLSHNQFTNAAVTILADVISSNHIEHLDLLHCLQGANSLAILTAIANSATLQYLDLSHNDIGDNEVNYVTSAITANNNLHSINLTNNCFDPQSIHIILFALAKMDLIHYLNLSSYSIVDKLVTDLEAVCISNNRLENIVVCEYTNLKYNDYLQQCVSRLILSKLCINHHTVCDSEVWILESVITNSSSICHLDLSETTISDSRKRMIMGAIKKYSMLMHLNLYGFKFSGGVINILVSLLAQNTKLKYLNIARCGLNIMFLVALADVLCTHKELLHIDLSYNHLSTTTGTDISFVLPETAVLQHLNISACRLKEVVFLNVIKTLTWLDLSYNPISDQGAGDVAKLITNNVNLQHLNLFKCAFESRGVLMIIKALKNLIKLQYLNLGSNHLSDELECIAVEMAAVITNNKVIQDLYLPHCQFCKRDMMMLFKAMTFITCLQHVDIGCNEISNTCIRDVFTKNLSLQEIRMDKLVMSQTELNEVSGILAKFRVQHFSLCQCFISDKQLSQLCEIFNSSDVTHFSITDCVFSDEHMGGSKLFESLRDTWNLKHLDLKGITLTDDSIEHVIATNENIEYFSLIDCTMSDSKRQMRLLPK